MVAVDSKGEIVFRQPEVRQNDVSVRLILRREYKNKRRNIRGGREVKSSVTHTTFQVIFRYAKRTGIPLVHRHPSDRLLDPLIEAQLTEGILLTGVLLCRVAGGFDFVYADGFSERGIGFFPDLWVSPVFIHSGTVNDRVEGRVDFSALNDVQRLLMHLVADAFGVVPGSGDEKVQRLHTGIAGPLRHDIVELPVWLCM